MTSPAPQRPAPADRPLDLPPGFEAVGLRELGDAVAHAAEIAPERGAGTIVWVRRFDLFELAVVLEPEEPLSSARRVLYGVLNAVADALSAHVPPQKPVTFQWPDTVLVDGGIVGGARLVWPEGTAEKEVPDWLVAGVLLRNLAPHVRAEIGTASHPLDQMHRRGTSLIGEGVDGLDGAQLVAAFARHLMAQIDAWQTQGFDRVAHSYLRRLPRSKSILHGLDESGDLLIRHGAHYLAPERRVLVDALATAGWMDPATGEPWL